MNEFDTLLAAKVAAADALAAYENALHAELVAAKDAHRTDPTPTNRERKAAAVAAVQEHRARIRAGRTSLVGGDAFVSTDRNGG